MSFHSETEWKTSGLVGEGMYVEQLKQLVNDRGLNKQIYSYFWSASSQLGKCNHLLDH